VEIYEINQSELTNGDFKMNLVGGQMGKLIENIAVHVLYITGFRIRYGSFL